MPSRVRVFVDFDGTISLEDTTDVVLERFADPSWQKVEAEWLAGHIGSRECMKRQVELIRATPEQLDELCEEIPLDTHFPDLVTFCRKAGIRISVVSDGLDRTITRMLSRFDLDIPVLANRLVYLGDRRWTLEFPYANAGCESGAGNCKCLALTGEANTLRILIGDGRSDFCAAETADFVIAKAALAEHCQANGVPFIVFGNFAGATPLLADWVNALEHHYPASGTAGGTVDAEPHA
jgi:2,3-diketo-5-methylthio-1-phosphopentane phosphatase